MFNYAANNIHAMCGMTPQRSWDPRLRAYGYAPGSYSINCWDCQGQAHGCDKRALRCEGCATERLNADGYDANGSPVTDELSKDLIEAARDSKGG